MAANTSFPVDLTISPVQAGSKVSEILVAMRARADVGDLVSTTGMAKLDATANGWTVTLEANTSAVDDTANGGVGSGARIDGTSANVGVMLRRVRVTRTTLLDSVRGWLREFLRVRPSGAGVWDVEFHGGPSLADPAPKVNARVRLDSSGASSHGYVELDLGYLIIPEEGALGGVALEIWARRISGTGDLHMNFVRNLPATPDKDLLTRVVVPAGAAESWLGSELVTPPYKLTADPTWVAGTFPPGTTDLLMNGTNEAGGVTPNTGIVWPAGRHRLTFYLLNSLTSSPAQSAKVRVVSVGGGGAGAEVASKTLPTHASGTFAEVHTLEFDSVASTAYQPQVNQTADGTSSVAVQLQRIEHTFVPSLGQNEQAHTEPDSGVVHKRDSSGNLLGILGTEGEVPVMVPPGPRGLFIIPFDVPRAGYSEPESVKARTVTVTAVGAERFLS